MTTSHSARDSLIGYYYQCMYALVILLRSADGSARVSVETDDDVVLEGDGRSLFQLKHSLSNPPALTVSNVGLWKTLRIWAESIKRGESGRFVFVTMADFGLGSPLSVLSENESDRSGVVQALTEEAERVLKERGDAMVAGSDPPHVDRAKGCQAFLDLDLNQRTDLIDRMVIRPHESNATEIGNEVEQALSNTVVRHMRSSVVARLMEWWDRQMIRALLKQRDRTISKDELVGQIHELAANYRPGGLPTSLEGQQPENWETELSPVMSAQIDIIDGGVSRKRRAAVAHWRARNQRDRWIDDRICYAEQLKELDEKLQEMWANRHGPMKDDHCNSSTEIKSDAGRTILDWTHHNAFMEVKKEWQIDYLIQGTYQMLASKMVVGWHPDYLELVKPPEKG